MMDLVVNPALAEALLTELVEVYCARADRILPALDEHIDVIQVNDDLGTQAGPMLSPALYRKMIVPHQRRLFAHLLTTDPQRFWVAVRAAVEAPADPGHGPSGSPPAEDAGVVGFASASVRDGLWFLAMLFVDPEVQAGGIGQALMDRAQAGRDVDPGGPAVPGPDDPLDSGIHTWGMCTDAVQPISNAMYARRGMVPRIPIWRLFGEVRRWGALPPAPASLEVSSFDAVAGD
jgi:GNAT superfamily N-acetyltransferase